MNYSTDLLGNTIFLSRTVKYCEIFVKKKKKGWRVYPFI
jgi:hypothetical protein